MAHHETHHFNQLNEAEAERLALLLEELCRAAHEIGKILRSASGIEVQNNIEIPSIVVTPDGRMDRKNAAIYLGLSVKTLAMYASSGTGPKFIKRGRVWYRIQDLDEWVIGGVANSTAQARVSTRKPPLETA